MSNDKANFQEIDEYSKRGILRLASKDGTAFIEGSGDIKLNVGENNYSSVKLTDTLYVPNMNTNLISVNKITKNGFNVIFNKNEALVINEEISFQKENVILKAQKAENGLYYMDTKKSENNCEFSYYSSSDDIVIWHKKLGHLNEADLKLSLKNELLNGLKFNPAAKLGDCETCIRGKFSRLKFPVKEASKITEPLYIIHSDVCGPFRIQSPGGARYFVTFIDEHSRYTKVYFLRQKNEVLKFFKEFKNEVENFIGKRIKYLQSDNGRAEYCNTEFDIFLKECGIQRRLSAPYTPQQNGLAERKNRSLLEKARCLLLEAKLPAMFWAEAINTANYLLNRSPSTNLNGETPFQRWVGHVPSVRHLHIFGAKAFILNRNSKRGKFAARTEEGIFMGYSEISKAFRIWIPSLHKIIISRNVKVINKFEHSYVDDQDSLLEENQEQQHDEENELIFRPYITSDQIPEVQANNQYEVISNERQENEQEVVQNEESVGRPQRSRRPPKWTDDFDMTLTNNSTSSSSAEEISFFCGERNFSQNENSEEWHDAIKSEIKSHIKNGTWILTEKKTGRNIIDCKMVLKNKYNSDGSLERKKARLVARGFTQRPNIDFTETFAPVVKLSSIRLLLGITIEEHLKMRQLDVSTAYLNGDLDEEIYMKMPSYLEKFLTEIILEESGNENQDIFIKSKKMLEDLRRGEEEKVCLLKRALYGLKQSGRQWFRKLDETLKELSFRPSTADPCIYIYSTEGEKIFIAVYVDDLIIAASNEESLNSIKQKLMKRFEMRDLGDLSYCLGIEFSQNENGIVMNQRKYIEEVLKKFNMENCKSVSTPMELGLKLEKATTKENEQFPYQNLIGSLMYLSVATRPDISFAVSYLSQFNSCFGNAHWTAAKRILRYLQGTKDTILTYRRTGQPITGFADADWASCTVDRKSYTGFCFLYAGGPVSWESKKQRTVALSTAEAEYMALTEAAKEAIHLKQLANDMGIKHNRIVIFNDNQAAQSLSINPIISSKSKHIAIKEHFIREAIQNGDVEVRYRKSEDMEADILTKALSGPKHSNCISRLGFR